MKGKGIRLTNGITNVIIQNVRFTDLNPQYIWGGDAVSRTFKVVGGVFPSAYGL